MTLTQHLSFANVASGTALIVALAGGGAAVAAGLANNSVGSPQIKAGAVNTSELAGGAVTGPKVKNDTLTGADIKESTLGKVKSAAAVDSLRTVRAVALPGQTKTLATKGTLTLQLVCTDLGSGSIEAELQILTSADNATLESASIDEADFDVADGGRSIGVESGTTQASDDARFVALTATGTSWKGDGFVVARPTAAPGSCLGELTLY